jgi:Sulfotransferase domain
MSNPLLPTFIIGGAPRSGTTYLAEALARHPDVSMARPFIPEPKVFMGPRQPVEVYRDRYRALFEKAGPARARGEKTSYYLENPDLCDSIHAVAPGVRMLFIVREPVSRAYSNYLWSTKNGLETLSFEDAIAQEGKRPNPLSSDKSYARPFDYLERGDYCALAAPYLERFGRDNVLFVLYEDIADRPARLLDRIQDFIGVDRLPFTRLDVGVVNSAKEVGPPIAPETQALLHERMRPSMEHFAALTGLDISPWRTRPCKKSA